jgi:hypothetical protein
MNNLTLIETLKQKDLTKYDNLNILFQMCLNILETDTDLAIKTCKFVKNKAAIQAGNIKFFELYNQCLLMLAPYCFDEYLLYLEKDREPQKRFYLPRRKTLKMVVDDLQELQDRKIDFLGVSLPPRVGKALSDDTPVLTSKGWINHGDLMVGDVVINDRGQFVKVLQVHPKCQMEYRVTFTDGTHIDCHGNHEWKVYNKHRTKYEILETKSMISGIEYGDERIRGHRYMYQMPITDFVIGKKKSLKVQPYTLGVWLGDGRNNNPDICGDKRDTEEELKGILEEDYVVAWHTTHKTTEVEYYGIYGLRKGLQAYGMCHSRQRTDKNIPNEYFTASIEQRLKLLAGLIDTDGCLRRKEQRYDFTTAEPRLRDDFISLISTFGWRASVKQCEPKMSSGGIQGRHTYWVISFNPTCYIPCRLERKQLHTFSQPRRIAIQSIQPISGVQGNCITVEGGLYLAGKTLKITHNSTLCIFFMTWQMGKYPNMANLMSGHSDKLTKGFFSEALNIIKNPEYLWKDVFP